MRIPPELEKKEKIEKLEEEFDMAYMAYSMLIAQMKKAVARGYMTLCDLIAVVKWKSPRVLHHCYNNSEDEVKEITKVSFATKSERERIKVLLNLHGVSWPMASVILHFSFPEDYPILDVRVMETVGGSKPYTFDKWREYTELCRSTAKIHGITIRTVDKALWQYNKNKSRDAK